MTFLDHLEELRWRIIKSLMGIGVGIAVTFLLMDPIMELLLRPIHSLPDPPRLQVLKIQGMFMIKWTIALVGGIVFSLPVIFYQFWKFIIPALRKNEKNILVSLVVFSSIAFIVGILFSYTILVPFSIEFFSSTGYIGVENNFSINYYLDYLFWMLLGGGILFELPVIVLILAYLGVVTPPFLRHYRKHAVVAILILSAIITPPDPVSMVIMSVPLIILYEISIGLSKLFT